MWQNIPKSCRPSCPALQIHGPGHAESAQLETNMARLQLFHGGNEHPKVRSGKSGTQRRDGTCFCSRIPYWVLRCVIPTCHGSTVPSETPMILGVRIAGSIKMMINHGMGIPVEPSRTRMQPPAGAEPYVLFTQKKPRWW